MHAASEALFPLGDVIFLSKEFAGKKGFTRPQDFLAHVSPAAAPGALLVCPWGSAGAWALDLAAPEGSQLSFSAAFPPEGGVVDSIGAGDTFLAAMVFALGKGAAVQAGLTFACQVMCRSYSLRDLDCLWLYARMVVRRAPSCSLHSVRSTRMAGFLVRILMVVYGCCVLL